MSGDAGRGAMHARAGAGPIRRLVAPDRETTPGRGRRSPSDGGHRVPTLPRGVQMQYFREPRRDDRLDRFLAPVVEMVAVRNDLHGARAAGAYLDVFGWVARSRLPVSADKERGTFHFRG